MMLELGKLRLAAGEIQKADFMKIVLGAANNMKIAKKCYETIPDEISK